MSLGYRDYLIIVLSLLLAILIGLSLSGCASVEPLAYTDLPSSKQLAKNTQDQSGRTPYSYSPSVDWRKFDKIIVDPVAIYQGRDQQLDKLSQEDRLALTQYMRSKFSEKLRARFALVDKPAPGALRLKLTLTGAETNTPVVGTLTHFDLAGNLYNGVQTVRDQQGLMSGSVIYAAEIYDASTNQLLTAFVSKQYPNPMNIVATIGTISGSEAGVDIGADALVKQLN